MFVELIHFGGSPPSEPRCHLIGRGYPVFAAATGELHAGDGQPARDDEFVTFHAEQHAFWLENHCRVLACRINGVPVAMGERHLLHDADAIEIGVAALIVSEAAETPIVSAQGASCALSDGRLAACAAAENVIGDLTALAGSSVTVTGPADFSDLIALAGEYALAEHYHDAPTADAETPLAILNASPGTSVILPGDADDTDPLAELAVEYRRALLHHERSHTYGLKTEPAIVTALAAPEDPFLDAPERFANGSLLDDLLGDRQHIDTVLAELDTFAEDLLFAPEARQEILALLAPREVAGQHTERAAQLARQEHHMISVDSHFPLSSTTTIPPEAP